MLVSVATAFEERRNAPLLYDVEILRGCGRNFGEGRSVDCLPSTEGRSLSFSDGGCLPTDYGRLSRPPVLGLWWLTVLALVLPPQITLIFLPRCWMARATQYGPSWKEGSYPLSFIQRGLISTICPPEPGSSRNRRELVKS